MATSNINMKMTNQNDFWTNLYDLGKTLAPWGVVGWTLHQAINKVFKYFSDSRDAELRKLISNEVDPRFDRLEDKIDKILKNQK
jgi:hypothetical protein